MSDKIEEIRERWAEFESLDHQSQVWDAHLYMRRAHNDRATLLAEVDRLREALRWYADLSNHLPVERRSPGDPDPAVIFLEEPPILLDGGALARKALEAKP